MLIINHTFYKVIYAKLQKKRNISNFSLHIYIYSVSQSLFISIKYAMSCILIWLFCVLCVFLHNIP